VRLAAANAEALGPAAVKRQRATSGGAKDQRMRRLPRCAVAIVGAATEVFKYTF
jgi:hypothetical protein